MIPLYLYLYIQYWQQYKKLLIIKKKNLNNFKLYLKFINYIIEKNDNKEINFYEIYENFIKDNGVNLLNLQENEK